MRYLPLTKQDRDEMLASVGVSATADPGAIKKSMMKSNKK